HLGAVLEPLRVGGPGDALAAVVVPPREVVVQVDVVVGRAARAVEVEHATGGRGVRPELDLARLGREGERALRGHYVDALMRPACPGLAEVAGVGRRPENREDDRGRRLSRACGRRSDQESREGNYESEGSSGCRPERVHGRPKGQTLAEGLACRVIAA